MDAFLEYLFTQWPVTFPVVLAVVVTWLVARLYARLSQTEKTCASHDDEIKTLHNKDLQLGIDHRILARSVDKVRAFLAAGSSNGANFFSGKHSPRRLNASGEKLMRDAHGEAFLEKHKEQLFSKMDERKPQTAFDVEAYANEILLVYSLDPAFNAIKDFLYNYPDMEVTNNEGKKVMHSVTLGNMCFVLSLRLRDMYLDAHPELQPQSIPAP